MSTNIFEMLAVAGVDGLYGNLGCAWQMCRSNGVSETALIYNNYNTATIGTMSQFITYYSDTGTNIGSDTARLSHNPLTNIIEEGWFGYIYYSITYLAMAMAMAPVYHLLQFR